MWKSLINNGFGCCSEILITQMCLRDGTLGLSGVSTFNMNASMVMIDGGGLQEEISVLNVPCITLRHNTERSIPIWQGKNVLTGNHKNSILAGASLTGGMAKRRNASWSG
jgi:UDP-N-acetylglucosamine 2-epimerase (non-hydrolysing)